MLLVFSDLSFLLFIVFSVFSVLYLFLVVNQKSNYLNKSKTTVMTKSNVNKVIESSLILRISVVVTLLMLLWTFFYKGVSENIWFNHLRVSNTSIFLFFMFLLIFIFIFLLLLNKIVIIQNLQFEYFFTILFTNIFLPLIFFSNNILTFFFILEVVSNLILFKFIVGRDWELLTSTKKTSFFNYSNNYKSTSFINIIFFQYWVSFFSSVLIVYSLLMFLYYFGSTEWVILNFLSSIDVQSNTSKFNSSIYFVYVTFLIGFFLKLGIAPVHFYKIEIYKSIPFLTILIYTIYFFYVFFIFFCLLVTNYLTSLSIVWYNIGLLILALGVFIVMFLLFDIYSLKAFFAYSTIVNSMAFLSLVISLT